MPCGEIRRSACTRATRRTSQTARSRKSPIKGFENCHNYDCKGDAEWFLNTNTL